MDFSIAHHDNPALYAQPLYKRSWTQDEIVAMFPAGGIDIVDVGAGDNPITCRPVDRLVTIDFDRQTDQSHVCDFTKQWPIEPATADFVYASHVLEHLYHQDRDRLIMNIHDSLRPGGLLFVRVPHWSSIQGTGWEHYTLYGLNGLTSLTHGRNPMLPQFDMISTGVFMGAVTRFQARRSAWQRTSERVLNRSFRATDGGLCRVVCGVPEVQFLLRKPTAATRH